MPLPVLNASDAEAGPSLPAGNHVARLVAAVGLGLHKSTFEDSDGVGPRVNQRLLLAWEVPAEGAIIGHVFTLSLHRRSALRPVVEALLGRPLADKESLDLGTLLDLPCLVDVKRVISATGREFPKL